MSSSNTIKVKPILLSATPAENRQQWIQLVSKGTLETVDKRGPFQVNNLTEIIKNSLASAKATNGTLPIDYNHSIDLAGPKGQPTPAAGWILQLEARQDGIWGLAEWTPTAFNEIKERQYRYISPVLGTTDSKEVGVILRASLTNNPNLTLASLNTANNESLPEMNDTFLPKLRDALGLTANASEQDILEKVTSLLNVSKHSADPAEFVPIQVFQNTLNELKRVNAGISLESAEREVSRDISEFRLFPFMREWAVNLCTVNKPAYDKFINGTINNLKFFEKPLNASPLDGHSERLNTHRHNPIDKTIAANLGLTDQDIKTFGSDQ